MAKAIALAAMLPANLLRDAGWEAMRVLIVASSAMALIMAGHWLPA